MAAGEFGIVQQLFRAGDALLPGGNQRDFNDPVRVQRGDQRLAQAVQRDAAGNFLDFTEGVVLRVDLADDLNMSSAWLSVLAKMSVLGTSRRLVKISCSTARFISWWMER